jgi:4-amino-4-deoxy-L-arabinose transferase-like glycosyltransferase
MEHSAAVARERNTGRDSRRYQVVVVLVAALAFLGTAIAPPRLMDDVDSVQAQISRNMLESGDWVSARLDGVLYLEKSPLGYWMTATSFQIFGIHDWAARLPFAICTILLCWLTCLIGQWAFTPRAGFYAGLSLATCIGLWLFTRILIPDVILTLTIALALWSFLRALDEEEPRPRLWAAVMAASVAAGLLLKGLIAAVFPVGAAIVYLVVTRQLFARRTWDRLHLPSGILIAFVIAAPWHILATIANPPYFDFTMRSEPGHYHGFFWFYFFNEHVFRFLNMRFPRDYNTVPRPLFWAFHFLWLFPWSAWFFNTVKLGYRGSDRAHRTRLLTLCWIGFVMVFFTFSTTQEYYSMPIYPALGLLLGCAIDRGAKWPYRAVAVVAGLAAIAIAAILVQVWNLPAPGDISQALTQHPEAYTLSLGHMGDLTIDSFAYLRLPLIVAGIAFVVGAVSGWRRNVLGIAAMMVIFFHAARLALVTFDPYLGSYALAQALKETPPGRLIVDDQYYTFSSVFFYASERANNAYLLNGRVNNLEYGSNAPGAPQVFIDDARLKELWPERQQYYIVAEKPAVPRIEGVVGKEHLHLVKESGGKYLYSNQAITLSHTQ